MPEERPADVLEFGDDDPPRHALTPRRVQSVAALALLVAAVAGVAELRERRAAAAEERRLDRVVDLAVESRGISYSYRPAARGVRVDLELQLRNDGPRDVVVERGDSGAYALVQPAVEVAAGRTVPLLLRRELTCSPSVPPPPAPLEVLVLDVRTAAGPRQVELPLEPSLVTDEAPRPCGLLPLEALVEVVVQDVDRDERGVSVTLAVTSSATRELTVEAVQAAAGLVATAVPLPLRLPAQADGRRQTRVVEVVVDVRECVAARSAPAQLRRS